MIRLLAAGIVSLLALGVAEPPAPVPPPTERKVVTLDPTNLEIIKRESGPVNYYSIVHSAGDGSFIHSAYRPPYPTAVLGYQVPDELRQSLAKIRWKWRARVLPVGGNECERGKEDSAATIYLTWKRGLRWYTLKYCWSAVGPKGAVCDKKRNPFVAQDTVIVESGGPLDEWKTVEVDLDAVFRSHFAGGDPNAGVPAFGGFGIMSDGDQTQSLSEADFAGFALELR
ncbi:MAG TPA: DUF3047 domain-containing protein [Myxococcales bacterium]